MGGALAIFVMIAPLSVQPIPVRRLTIPPVTISFSFSQISAVHEFPDGRVLVVDHPGQAVHLVDFRRDIAVPVGRSGTGPGEYRLPERLIVLPGDSVGIWDAGNSRFLVLDPNGMPAGARGPTGRPFSASNPLGTIPLVRAGDRYGGLYGIGQPTDGQVDRSRDPERRPILRWSAEEGRPEVAGFLPFTPPPGAQRTPVGYITPVSAMVPFLAGPVWAVSIEGTVAIVHPDPYRVELVTRRGRQTTGPAVPYQRIPVSEGHRRAYLEEWERPVPVQVFRRGESGSEIRIQPRGRRSGSVPWPSHLPPFLSGAARFAPDGMLWVERTTPAEAPPRFDLFDASGRVRLQVELPAAGMRLVGFGAGTVYLVRLDAEGEERLERWRLP